MIWIRMLLVLTNSCSMPPTKRKRAATEVAKGAAKRRRRDASEASTTQTAPSVPSYGDALIARVTADVTATVTTSIAGIIKETVEAAVRRAIEGQSGATSGDGVDGQVDCHGCSTCQRSPPNEGVDCCNRFRQRQL